MHWDTALRTLVEEAQGLRKDTLAVLLENHKEECSIMRIFAHRGVSAHLPENTKAAFARAIELGIDGIELDVHLSADRIPVVIHDDTADRTTNGTGGIGEFTARQLGLLDAGAGESVPTLSEVLAMAAGKLRVNIELKDATSVEPIVQVVTEATGVDWFASSADWGALAELRRLLPDAKTYPLCVGNLEKLSALLSRDDDADQFAGRGIQAAIDFAVEHGGEGVSIWEGGLDHDDIARIHAAGLQVWVWTVNDPERALELLEMGADAVCTDDPELIQQILPSQCSADAPSAAVESAVLESASLGG